MSTQADHHGDGRREVPLDVENYPKAPNDLVLEQVHVYIRHGKNPIILVFSTIAELDSV